MMETPDGYYDGWLVCSRVSFEQEQAGASYFTGIKHPRGLLGYYAVFATYEEARAFCPFPDVQIERVGFKTLPSPMPGRTTHGNE